LALLDSELQAFLSALYSALMRVLLALKSLDDTVCAMTVLPNIKQAANATTLNLPIGFFMIIPLS
jgi:hypothetical protein